ncbi:MAG: rhodanese-like domain-containing protein [Planctomycetota bacterium]
MNQTEPMSYRHLAAYRFVTIDDPDGWVSPLEELGAECAVLGTVLLGTEGINLGVCLPDAHAERFTTAMSDLPFAPEDYRQSVADEPSYRRLKVRVKPEIIRFGVDVGADQRRAPSMDPDELKRRLDGGEPLLLLDARNRQEVERGTFRGAVHLDIGSFGQFPEALTALERDGRPIVTFCTGGVRCEKSALYMKDQGFDEVYQLDGGILEYLARHGAAHYAGDCFVFDERVAVDGDLKPVAGAVYESAEKPDAAGEEPAASEPSADPPLC